MVGINRNKRHNNDRLSCIAYKKVQNTNENLQQNKRKIGFLYASIVSDITSEDETMRGSMKLHNDLLTIETSDFVDELEDGDFIEIQNFNTLFLITEKHYVIDYKNTTYMKLNDMSKRTRFSLRGKI